MGAENQIPLIYSEIPEFSRVLMDFCGCKTALLKKVWVQLHPLRTHTYATPVSKPAGCSWLPKATLFLRAVIAMVLKQHTVRQRATSRRSAQSPLVRLVLG